MSNKIDRNKPLDVCKIEVCNYVKLKKEKDGISINKAFDLISEETNIPKETIKRWFYPDRMERYNKKRREESCVTSDTGVEWDERIPESHRQDILDSIDSEPLDNFMNSIEKKILNDVRERKRKKNKEQQKQIEKIKNKIDGGDYTGMPEGVFETIVIDPPWNYGTDYDVGGRRVASPYPEMSQEELLEIELPSADDCVLFLWTTHKFIWNAKELLDHWNFTYRATLVWNKEKIGMGDLFRMQCEFCLVGIKGKPLFNNNHTHRDIIIAPRKEHSRKPDEFYDMVNELCVGRKLDYFAREQRYGWETFGGEL